jgi:protocatechuate 3,4-dioxygenase, beta subunit
MLCVINCCQFPSSSIYGVLSKTHCRSRIKAQHLPKHSFMKSAILLFVAVIAVTLKSCSQTSSEKSASSGGTITVGDGCEGCEAIFESPIPFEQLSNTDTLPGFDEQGPKIEISGIIYQQDGITPAKDVVLYVYHTDQRGKYSTQGTEKGWGKRHGYRRGWIKTDASGRYRFFTLVPASYPDSRISKHIHPTIKEPGKTEYWIEEFLFDNDSFLTKEERERPNPRGGSGILKPVEKDGMLHATRNIILGLNVPNYPPVKPA